MDSGVGWLSGVDKETGVGELAGNGDDGIAPVESGAD